ncbi:glutamate synthase subunit beta [Ruminococcus sp. YE282]|uniref:glutamate synthase subunit beta n=1 Tax=Ruminococcus sp. YE282 TaxID=3158780 RepID=UPI0008878042|nr:glutamate synthase subunit beta [Ruminococcus bromii]SCY24064.1 glutamate synthase (NADPH/NADH) small chain [Ruminococcus bromii]
MGKPTGFMEYKREDAPAFSVKERIKNYNEFHTPLSQEEQKKQGARCMECGVPFCQAGMVVGNMVSGCPLNNLIPEWNDLIFKGAWEQAYNRLKITSNFPEFTSRVCPALCEKACTCGANGDPVTVKANEYSIVENAYVQGYACAKPPKVRTGKNIAIIGSGPSGLAAADQLNLRGHSVTVFERSDRVGGLLMYGIPNMKLEKSVIDRKINIMKEEGVEFKTNVNVGKDVKASELLKNYDRVILACGASHPRDITVEGRDANGIYFAVDFLKSTTKSLLDNDLKDGTYISAKGKNVMVIGGGDTGNDCVGTSIRHGAKSVLQLEMMPKLPDERTADNPWPQWPRVCKTDYGQEEAIEVFGHDPRVYQTTVKEFLKDKNGNVKGAILVKLSPEKDKKTGRMIMTPVAGSEYKVDVELVLIAAGFLGSESYVTNAFGVETNARTNVATQPNSFKTNVDRVFTAGDMHRGQSLVVWAIREGRDAAREVDESLMGYTNL